MRLRHLAIILAASGLFSMQPAVAQDLSSDVRSDLRACYKGAISREEKYGCMGTITQTCIGQTELSPDESVLPCATAEVSAWRELLREETAAVAGAIRASMSTDDPFEPSLDACLDQLDQMTSAATVEMNRQCDFESLPENSAGKTELANTLCLLRETARSTIRMYDLKQRVAQ